MFDFISLWFLTFFQTIILDRRYERKTLLCNLIQSNKLKSKMCQFEENCKKKWRCESGSLKNIDQNSRYDVIEAKFPKFEKCHLIFFYKIMWSKFHQNQLNSVQIKGCDRRTHRARPGVNMFSPKMTEYKNCCPWRQ